MDPDGVVVAVVGPGEPVDGGVVPGLVEDGVFPDVVGVEFEPVGAGFAGPGELDRVEGRANGLVVLPGFEPPIPTMIATAAAAPAPTRAPTDTGAMTAARSRSHSVRRRRSSCAESSVCWFSHDM